MKKLLFFLLTLSLLSLLITNYSYSQTTYTLTPDFPDNTRVTVNYDTTLTATISPAPGFSITVSIKLQWETTSRQVSSDPTTGKVSFTVKPPSSFSRTPQTVTFSSSYFATVTTHIVCVPGSYVEGTYDSKQHWDPIENKDMVINMTVKDSESGAVIMVPSAWDVKVISAPSGTSDVQFLAPSEIVSGVYQISLNSISNTAGKYVVEVKASYSDYIPIPSDFTIYLNPPIVVITYKFQTGEAITIKPEDIDAGNNGIQVSKGCSYFDMEFKDYQGRPIRVYVNSEYFDLTIATSTITFEKVKANGQATIEQLADNLVRVHFSLVESWYVITPSSDYAVWIGNYYTSIGRNEVKVATIRSGFNPWDFILNPFFMVPVALIGLAILGKILFRKKEE
jgi:hypothetical protein